MKAEILGKKFVDDASIQNPATLAEFCINPTLSKAEKEKREQASIKAGAEKKAKESIAADLGHETTSAVIKEIKNHEAVTKANLDTGKLKGLNASQFKVALFPQLKHI